jgi:hypothetical protein
MENIMGELLERIINCLLPLLDRQATVFFTGGAADADGLLRTIDGLLTSKAKIVASDNFMKIAPQSFRDSIKDRLLTEYGTMQAHIKNSNLIVIPILTRNTLAKTASGIQDNLPTCGIAAALMRGIPGVAVTYNCDPAGSHFAELGLNKNTAYSGMMRAHMRTLASFGVKMADKDEFVSVLEANLYPTIFGGGERAATSVSAAPVQNICPAPPEGAVKLNDLFITCEDVMSVPRGASVQIKTSAVLTPLAAEYIAGRGIAVIRA